MKLKKLIKSLTDAKLVGKGNIEIKGLEYDSRRIKPGMLFAAITGYRLDGKEFIGEAIRNGAVAILSDREIECNLPVVIVASVRKALADLAACFYDYPGRKLKVIGVTGTNGKSTTVFLIKKILDFAGIKTGMINSLVYDTTVEQFKAERTTPDSIEIQYYLHQMEKAGCEYAVIEVSSHALVLNRVDNIDFTVGLYTNFSRDHLDFHKSMDKYLSAKKLLLGKIAGRSSYAVINQDVPEFVSLIDEYDIFAISYSPDGHDADIKIDSPKLSPTISFFNLMIFDDSCEVWFNLPGRYNLANAAGAAAAATAIGIDIDIIKNGLELADPILGRYQPVIMGQPFSVVIDYAHTPDALERLCQSAREITTGRILTLFGCGGDRDSGKRPLMAEAASRNSDFVILTSDNPRTENPEKIFKETLPGMTGDNYEVVSDRREAIRAIIGKAEKNDTVLIAGKGAEDYQEIGTTRHPFNDKTEIESALKALGYKQVKAG